MQRPQGVESGGAILATILLFSRISFALPQRQLWKAPLPYSAPAFLPTGQNAKEQQQRKDLSFLSTSSSGSNNPWVLKSSPDLMTKEAQNVRNLEPQRDSALEEPWVHESGLEYRDRFTIEAARSVARFARTNQYLGSFKTRRGEMLMEYFYPLKRFRASEHNSQFYLSPSHTCPAGAKSA